MWQLYKCITHSIVQGNENAAIFLSLFSLPNLIPPCNIILYQSSWYQSHCCNIEVDYTFLLKNTNSISHTHTHTHKTTNLLISRKISINFFESVKISSFNPVSRYFLNPQTHILTFRKLLQTWQLIQQAHCICTLLMDLIPLQLISWLELRIIDLGEGLWR